MTWAPLLLMGLLWLTGCAGPAVRSIQPSTTHLPVRVHLTDVPFYAQEALHCGPAALAMALQWSGVDVGPDALAEQVYTPGRRGSFQSELITTTRRNGRVAYPINGLPCLLEAVAAGQPVVVFQNLGLGWLPRWHYAVVVGFDLDQRQVLMHTGKKAHRPLGMATFERTWRRADHWGLLVMKPSEIPVCAREHLYLQAALGVQRADQLDAALTAFRAAARQWPRSVAAQVALGNALYASGQRDAAAAAFGQATRMAPDNPAAFNNLAHVLAEQGALDDAEAAARHAVELGGPHSATYRQTLEEILTQMGERP